MAKHDGTVRYLKTPDGYTIDDPNEPSTDRQSIEAEAQRQFEEGSRRKNRRETYRGSVGGAEGNAGMLGGGAARGAADSISDRNAANADAGRAAEQSIR